MGHSREQSEEEAIQADVEHSSTPPQAEPPEAPPAPLDTSAATPEVTRQSRSPRQASSAPSGDSSDYVSSVRSSSKRPSLPLTEGRTLLRGRFVIHEKLGEGGTGSVYRATDELRRTEIALKILHDASAYSLDALKREFRSRSGLSYPGLVRLHELFDDGSLQFFSMELVRGVSFVKYVRPVGASLGYDPARLTSCMRQLLDSLTFLHQKGKIHRDIKSENVLVTDSGKAVLLDFGLMLDATRLAEGGRYMQGTPGYLAPEIMLGQNPSPKSDAYALGALLYHCLTGWLPRSTSGGSGQAPPSLERPTALGITVPAQLEDVCVRLLANDPLERAKLSELAQVLGHEQRTAEANSQLVGRERELATLAQVFTRIETGTGPGVLWLQGSSGVGKSALIDRFLLDLMDSAWLLVGRCHEREAVPFKALDEVIDRLVAELEALPSEAAIELAPPEDALALARVFSALSRLPTVASLAEEELPPDLREVRRQAQAALSRILGRMSQERPVVIWIDDVQWGDSDSARFLLELCRKDEAGRCLFLLSHRPFAEDEQSFHKVLATGPLRPACWEDAQKVALNRLAPEEASALATRLLAEGPSTPEERAQQIAIVCREAGGSPLLLHELARHLREEGNACDTAELSLEVVIHKRLARLSPIAHSVFSAVCVSGAPVGETVVADVTGQKDLSEAVTELVSAHLVREGTASYPDALVPFHDGLRDAFLRTFDEERKKQEHLRLAGAYERVGVREAEAITRHYAAAGNSHRASRWAEIAGDAAATSLAFERAAGLFRIAMWAGEPGHAAVLQVKLANALADAGRGSEAAPLFLEAALSAEPSLALEYRRRAAEQWLVSGKVIEGRRVLRQVFREAELRFPSNSIWASLELLSLRLQQKFSHPTTPGKEARRVTELDLVRLDACRAAWPISFVSTMQAAVIQARFLFLARRAGEPYRLALGLGMEAVQRSIDGGRQRQNAEALRLEALELTEQLNRPHATAFLDFVDGHIGYMGGQWARARSALEQAEHRLRERCRSVTWELNSTRFFWGNALYHLGEYPELDARLSAWVRDADEREDDYARAGFRIMRARLVLHQRGRIDIATQEVTRALTEWPLSGLGVHRFMAELLRVQLHLASGAPFQALLAARELERQFHSSLMSRIQLCRIHVLSAVAYAALGQAAETSGRTRSRALTLAKARAHRLKKEDAPWALAHASYVQATCKALEEKPDARQAMLNAADLFAACGMRYSQHATRLRTAEAWPELDLSADAARQFAEVDSPRVLIDVLTPGWRHAPLLPASTEG